MLKRSLVILFLLITVYPSYQAGASSPATNPLMCYWFDHSGSLTTGGTAQIAMNNNSKRSKWVFQNVSSDTLWLNFGTTAVQDQPSIKILSNGDYAEESGSITPQYISIIGPTTGDKFTLKECIYDY